MGESKQDNRETKKKKGLNLNLNLAVELYITSIENRKKYSLASSSSLQLYDCTTVIWIKNIAELLIVIHPLESLLALLFRLEGL